MVNRSGRLATIRVSPPGRLVIFGDIHGDLATLEAGLELRGDDDVAIFLGDYADRGPDGIEVIERIDSLLDTEADRVVALKGNHEDYDDAGQPSFYPCTLIDEAVAKRSSWTGYFEEFRRFVDKLQYAAIVPGKLLCVHGGIPEALTLSDLEQGEREVETELMWNDPGKRSGLHPSRRGIGHYFGADITAACCESQGIRAICRSHEPSKALESPLVEHDGKIVTTSSTRMYRGRAFVIVVEPDSIYDGTSLQDAAEYLLDGK